MLSTIIPPKKLFFEELFVILLKIFSINFSFNNFLSLIINSRISFSFISCNNNCILRLLTLIIKFLFSSGISIFNEFIFMNCKIKFGEKFISDLVEISLQFNIPDLNDVMKKSLSIDLVR